MMSVVSSYHHPLCLSLPRFKRRHCLIFVSFLSFCNLVAFRTNIFGGLEAWTANVIVQTGYEPQNQYYGNQGDYELSQFTIEELKKFYADKALQCAAMRGKSERRRNQCGEALVNRRGLKPPPGSGSSVIVASSQDIAESLRYAIQYSKPTKRNSWTLPDPRPYPDAAMIVMILSGRENLEMRNVIRETWGKGHPIYFLIGGHTNDELEENGFESHWLRGKQQRKSDLQLALEAEQATHHDMIDTIHPESYYSLTHKVRYAYRWIINHNPQVEWFVKTDDDQFARIETLRKAFVSYYNPYFPLVIGHLNKWNVVEREGKWTEAVYEGERYPYYANGNAGYVVSRVIAEYVAFTPGLSYYVCEDAALGIWLDESSLFPTFIHNDYFILDDCMYFPESYLIHGHMFNATSVQKCYEKMDEWPESRLHDLIGRRNFRVQNTEQQEWPAPL